MSNFVIMKKPLLLSVTLCVSFLISFAQERELLVKSGEKGSLFIEHTVLPKEGLYSIGRIYHINAHSIASYNKMDYNKGLNIDQVIHIPLTDTNFSQKSNKGVPVYYIVGSGDGLYKISNQHKKVPVKKLKEWNKLPGESVQEGAKLIIGYFESKELVAYLKANPVKKDPVLVSEQTPATTETVVTKTEPVTPKKAPAEKPVTTETVKENKPEIKENKPEIKEVSKPTEPVFAKEENNRATVAGLGYFKPYYDQQAKMNKGATVNSGIFKTASGWQDGKYYILMDGVASGTIIKLSNPVSNKTVYAKVLGEMNGIRQNQGLDIRISNAAASVLGITDTEKFILQVNY